MIFIIAIMSVSGAIVLVVAATRLFVADGHKPASSKNNEAIGQ